MSSYDSCYTEGGRREDELEHKERPDVLGYTRRQEDCQR